MDHSPGSTTSRTNGCTMTSPAEHGRWIPHRHARALEPAHPGEELLQPMVVVPAGAHEDALELFPAHIRGIPHGGSGRHPQLGEGRDEEAVVVVQRRELGARREGDALHPSKKTI